ncbi:Murein DD-endopeptidase MepM and murein hydrolase activator NlpD, contain LysM domain [Micromonospora pattaloongensis]|uniref:Murein DD-endopeptidase MepM and murein hydrolase activator NlpD, contain LysM domain n=1 Tax=Micromonospora pattaloongensis TaxID=405436 RepID=A0A1H3M1P6_9ACTN|nr:M23 family metallopeptidase [Micromonospora pattaloongensis]SDY70496.1 Murein DD-endopeptidase MepM and murein hydrolase activator NlpD, contain LysM domain [Micromonospora pattaloongensis]
MGSHRRSLLSLLAAVVVTLPLASAGAAHADPRGDKRRIDAEVAKASAILEGATGRAQAAARRLVAATAALPAAQSRVAEARGQVAAAQVAANTARRKVTEAEAALDDAEKRYTESEQQVEGARDRVAAVVTNTYKGGNIVSLNLMMGSRDPMDAADRYGYVERLMASEQEALDTFLSARSTAKQAQDEAGAAQRRAVEARTEADRALAGAKRAQAEAEAAAAEVAALVAQRENALQVARQERSASLAKYRQAKNEAARIAAELAAWERRQRPSSGGGTLRPGAKLLMPTNGWKSSDFGMRFDPYYNVWQLHAGMDIAASGGAPIYAAADGTVMRAGWNGGYGNYTCISHGRSGGRWLSTCYAHQSSINVSSGQRVRRGQIIGRVGTTGASTGDHLHFEVRLNGEPVQPLGWLPACLC